MVSHIVRPGAIRPKGFHLQQGRSWLGSLLSTNDKPPKDPSPEALRSAVYATSVAKYVCKKGRRTVPPEVLLHRSRLLPTSPRPAGLQATPARDKLDSEAPSGTGTPVATESVGPAVAEALGVTQGPDSAGDALSWEAVEAMRLRGLKYASMFDGLTGLNDEFGAQAEGGEEEVLGFYGELVY